MKQHIVHDQAGAEYARGLEAAWSEWEPSLRQLERMLRVGPLLGGHDPEDVAARLRRAQYHAHAASELMLALRPPFAAVDANHHLMASLDSCRDTLGAIAERADDDELDDFMGQLGLQCARATRDAFLAARSTGAATAPRLEPMESLWTEALDPVEDRDLGPMLWGLVIVCAMLFGVLLVQVLVQTPAPS